MKIKLTTQEKLFREQAVQAAIDNNRLEGLTIDSETRALFDAWIENEISFDEVKQKIYTVSLLKSNKAH